MRNLSAAELLAAWESGLGRSTARFALALLGAAYPDSSAEEIARWSVGRRDARLLALRESLFGSALEGVSTCPLCGRSLELTFRVSDILVQPPQPEPPEQADPPVTVSLDGYRIRARPLNSLDLISIEEVSDLAEARQRLLGRCVLSAVRSAGGSAEEPVADVGELPGAVAEAVAGGLAQADPQADIRLELECSDCGHQWTTPFDISVFLAGEIRSWVRRLLREVHQLACAYGWSEAEILAMTPTRRSAYLEMLEESS